MGVQASLAVRYLTQDWAEQALERIETDEEVAKALGGLDVSLLAIVLKAPPGCYGFMFVHFDEGGLQEYRVGYDYDAVTKGMPSPTFVISGDYDVFAQIQRGELSERRALLTGKLHLTGGMWKALKHMGAVEAITRSLNAIECET